MAQNDLSTRFPWMTPIKSPPTMTRLNGCGTGLYGSRDYDPETKTYVATLCFSLVFIPIFNIRSYRVAKADRGWYFLGREPLSAFSKGWNTLLLVGILASVGIWQFVDYTTSPAYLAKRQMATAHSLVAGGHLADGAKIYQTLITAGADESVNAGAALKDLLNNACQSAPLSESKGVYTAAAQVSRRGNVIAPADVAAKGMKLVADKGDPDPRDGIAMLDVIRPLVMDTRPLDARRLELLRKWAALEPANLDAIIPLASLLTQEGKLPEAKKLLLPFKSKLGDGEGARVLGTILAREGDYDGAYSLLWPFVKGRLDRLHAAEKSADDTLKRIEDRELDLLNNQKGPQDFYDRYKDAGKDQQHAMVQQYVLGKVKSDPDYARAQEALERETEVVPVALELGIVMLQRAQGQSNPQTRKTQLESAEQVFLAIGGVAGESDEYRLSLGQVYYWLGKQAEGRKLFDDYLAGKSRGFAELLQIAHRLRELGAVPDARAMAEEAYGKTTKPEEQHAAAGFRAACMKDQDDEITWLYKANKDDPNIKAELAKALGEKAFSEGRDDEAGRQYHSAIDAYKAMPRTAHSLNQTALAYDSLFRATGDHDAMERSVDYFQQAVDLQPSDSILLYNAGSTLLGAGLSDLIGNDLDLHALHQRGSLSALGYLYKDQASRDLVAQKVKDHPGIIRALSYLEKVEVLSPRNSEAWSEVFAIQSFTHNDEALRALEPRVKAADLDTSDELAQRKQYLTGVKDPQNLQAMTASIKRSEDVEKIARGKGGATAAAALDAQAAELIALDAYTGSADAGKAVKLAQEAQQIHPCSAGQSVLLTAYLFRAAKDLSHANPAFDAYFKKYRRSTSLIYLMAAAAGEPGPLQAAVLANADVQRALALVREESAAFPTSLSTYDWALLKNANPAEAEKLAEAIRHSPRNVVEQSLSRMLSPGDANEALETYWLLQILGKPDEAKQVLRSITDLGMPMPIQP